MLTNNYYPGCQAMLHSYEKTSMGTGVEISFSAKITMKEATICFERQGKSSIFLGKTED